MSYPTGPMRIISPYPPGGGTDVLARVIGQKLNEKFGQNVIVENRPGANGTVGAGIAAKSPPDGHTMVLVAAGYAAGASLYKNLPYDQTKDLAPVTCLASGPLVLVVHPSLPVRSTREFVAFAKSRPGQLNVGNSGTGSLPHLTAELLGSMSGIKLVHIPYKGPGAALIDVLSGQVPVYFMNVIGALPLVKSNKLRALGVSSGERSPIAPELPTIAEAGLDGFDMTNWYGVLVPSGTPRDVVAKLQQEVARAMNLDDTKDLMARSGMRVIASTPQQFSEFLSREMVKYERVIKLARIKEE
ncbi:MAG TPA: tripartite tricarboxylate transporter substrate binding protein [Burkholderiales bacterium]|nr:tripartite tricarboxylate transporter substrate binding protein [Burkholderiales bacterium]